MKPFETVGEGVSAPAPAPAETMHDVPAAPMERVAPPRHTQTQSTLAPTSEYVRYLLLALPARYISRGLFGTLFETNHFRGNALGRKLETFAKWAQGKFGISNKAQAEHASALVYNAAMGLGSLALTTSYSWTVYKDVKNIFGEAVAEETGKSPADITLRDLQNSDNRMVQKTMQNFKWRTAKRVLTDLLFFPTAALRSERLGDLMVGVKAGQAFAETWKRKTTMFEDLVTFVNNKINPRNGLGQAITVGEVFDLYQHYTETFTPERMFTNVLEQGTGEGARWAQSQSIFLRLTELMNKTYAYKHSSIIDPKTGHAIHQAEFTLPKFIYLLGHDLIDVRAPKQTLVTIEVANRYGIGAVKDMQRMLKEGQSLDAAIARYPVTLPHLPEQVKEEERNGVIAKGSTMQLDKADMAPVSTIDPRSISGHALADGLLPRGVSV
jgi:hypothetical protein